MSAARRDVRWPVALVTGASSGIGEAFAVALAARGSDLVVVARRRDRLEALAAELRSTHGSDVEVIVADLADPAQLAVVEARLDDRDRPVDLVVNNAGFGTRGAFAALPVDGEEAELRVNVLAPVRLTRAALPGMLAREYGGIINVSSVAGLQPIPYWATYSSTKAYLTNFSVSVHEEVKSGGVNVMALMPGFTRSEFQDRDSLGLRAIPSVLWMAAADVVTAALRAVEAGRATCIPGLGYRLFSVATRLTPWSISRRVGRAGGTRIQPGPRGVADPSS